MKRRAFILGAAVAPLLLVLPRPSRTPAYPVPCDECGAWIGVTLMEGTVIHRRGEALCAHHGNRFSYWHIENDDRTTCLSRECA